MGKINEYLADKLHIKLDLNVAQWGDYRNKMNTIVNSGEYYYMMFINSNNYSQLVNLGVFDNVTDKLQADTQVWGKYRNDMETGISDPDKALPQCIKELKGAGLDAIFSEAQKQIGEYFK